MLLDTIFAPFVKEHPICVMARAVLEGSWMPPASMTSLPVLPSDSIPANSCFPLWFS